MKESIDAERTQTSTASRQHELARIFQTLHARSPGFVMPNAWDAGSAIILANEGFEAIATTSAGIAFSLGKPDYDVEDVRQVVSREEMFDRMRQIVEAVNIPVNGDLEAGYGDTPEIVAQTIRMAIDAGLAGGNIEDKIPGERALYPESARGRAHRRCARADFSEPKRLRADGPNRRFCGAVVRRSWRPASGGRTCFAKRVRIVYFRPGSATST